MFYFICYRVNKQQKVNFMKKTFIALTLLSLSTAATAEQQYKIIFDNSSLKNIIPEGQTVFKSCNGIAQNGQSEGDGTYTINPTGDNEFDVYCDMTKDGGGWTKLTLDLIQQHFTTTFNEIEGFGEWRNGQLAAGDISDADGADVIIDINIPFEYDSFYLNNFYWKDIDSGNTGVWDLYTDLGGLHYSSNFDMSSGWTGDITVGTSDINAPTLSFHNLQGDKQGNGQSFKVPVDGQIFTNGVSSNTLTFRAMELGSEDEDVYVWEKGSIWVR